MSQDKDALPEDWSILREWLPADLDTLAKQSGFVSRTTGRVDAETWLRLILMHVAGGLSLEQTMLRASEMGWAKLSAVALFKRLRASQQWLAQMCDWLLGEQRRRLGEAAAWPQGWQVRLIDASEVREPGRTGSAWRVHYSLRLPEMVCDHYELTDDKGGEKFGRFGFAPGELVVADRGYSHRAGVAHVLENGAHALVRWNPHSFPLEDERGKVLDLRRWLRRLPGRACRERTVWFSHGDKRYELRLCALRKRSWPPRPAGARCGRRPSGGAAASSRTRWNMPSM